MNHKPRNRLRKHLNIRLTRKMSRKNPINMKDLIDNIEVVITRIIEEEEDTNKEEDINREVDMRIDMFMKKERDSLFQ